MALWVPGKVVENKRWGGLLHSLRVDADIEPYEAGQFIKIGLEIDGEKGKEIIGRPYSIVNPPQQRPLDFYFITLADGPLTQRLQKLQPGDDILIAPRAAGFLVLSEVPQARHLWLISTGTGIGPFLSILRSGNAWGRFEHVTLVHAVRTVAELSYVDEINQVVAEHTQQFTYIPFVSREPCDFALSGRVPQAIADGRLEQRAGIAINAADSQVMLCGNPDMVTDVMNILVERGLKKHKRRDPGQISVENYW
jgi:ferredoxin--NADP+ reductase